MDELVREYLEDRQAAGLSRRSIDNDIRPRLERIFLPWSRQAGVTSLAQLDQRQLNRFSSYLQTRGGPKGPLSPHTVASYIKTTNAFLAWTRRRGHGTDARCHRPKVPVREVEILTDAEVKALIKQAGTRDALILQTLAEAGLRVGELVGMRTGDLLERDVVLLNGHRERQMVIRVISKGDRERVVPIPSDLHRRLRSFARSRLTDGGTDLDLPRYDGQQHYAAWTAPTTEGQRGRVEDPLWDPRRYLVDHTERLDDGLFSVPLQDRAASPAAGAARTRPAPTAAASTAREPPGRSWPV
jgi:integrase